MRRLPSSAPLHARVLATVAVAVSFAMAACQPTAAPDAGRITVRAPAKAQAARTPVGAVHVLRDRLLARDGSGFARLAVPPALHARLDAGWRTGITRWPLDELPLDARLTGMLAALQAEGAEARLMAIFRQQFAGADRDIDQAIRSLVVFGGEYAQRQAAYTDEERAHVAQAIVATGAWAIDAPLADPARAQPFFDALASAARRTGIDGAAGDAAFATLGMQPSLDRLSPFIATLMAQLRRQYGLDLDHTLRGARATLLSQTGDSARVRLRYRIAGNEIDAVVPVLRIDGHWYLADFVRRAEASLRAGNGATD